jgi:hypothetical protein
MLFFKTLFLSAPILLSFTAATPITSGQILEVRDTTWHANLIADIIQRDNGLATELAGNNATSLMLRAISSHPEFQTISRRSPDDAVSENEIAVMSKLVARESCNLCNTNHVCEQAGPSWSRESCQGLCLGIRCFKSCHVPKIPNDSAAQQAFSEMQCSSKGT